MNKVTPEALDRFNAIERVVGSEQELETMVRLSAPITHEDGNRRYGDYLFKLEDDIVCDVRWMGDAVINKKEICGVCKADGDYCASCDSLGYVITTL